MPGPSAPITAFWRRPRGVHEPGVALAALVLRTQQDFLGPCSCLGASLPGSLTAPEPAGKALRESPMPRCDAGTSLDVDGHVSPHSAPLQMLLPGAGGSSVPVLQSMKMKEAF